MSFRKRRIRKAINKNDQKVRRGNAASGRPLLGSSYPMIQHLSIELNFYSPEGSALLQETRDFGPSDAVDFSAPCPGRCGDGEMDLESKIHDMIARHDATSESRGQCRRPLYADSNDVCGCELRCRINVRYAPSLT